jgi:Fic family protein
MPEEKRIAWRPIEALGASDAPGNGTLASLGALRDAWHEFLLRLDASERVAIRQRSLRRLAIETGIIERLYDIEWGLTLTLVAEGFAREIIERAGGRVDEQTRETLVAQRESLEMVVDFVRDERRLSTSFIKELHAALTRTQVEHDVVDSLGRVGRRPLEHGVWKTQSNFVRLEDGTVFECAPPEQVDAEMDRLLALYEELEAGEGTHPLVKAAWLHHRFVQIHPFADGNGRVARALTLLVLEKHQYAPLVVDRFHRDEYMGAIRSASEGNLTALVKVFARLESAALASELERPESTPSGTAATVAHTLASQLAALRQTRAAEQHKALRARNVAVAGRMDDWFKKQRDVIHEQFRKSGLADAQVSYFPFEADKAHYFRGQISRAARRAGHSAELGEGTRWWHLRVKLPKEGLQLSFVASLHGAGRDSGVMAVTNSAELKRLEATELPEYVETSNDAFRYTYSEATEDLVGRCTELDDLLDAGLSVALARVLKAL